jgi:hypothetical protein
VSIFSNFFSLSSEINSAIISKPEVKKYKTLSEFRKSSSGAYNSSYKNGWLYEILEKYIPSYKKRKSPN